MVYIRWVVCVEIGYVVIVLMEVVGSNVAVVGGKVVAGDEMGSSSSDSKSEISNQSVVIILVSLKSGRDG